MVKDYDFRHYVRREVKTHKYPTHKNYKQIVWLKKGFKEVKSLFTKIPGLKHLKNVELPR